MIKYQKIYEENKILDGIFNKDYPQMSEEIFKKNILELLVEIGELANETRCFKYWSSKESSEKEVVIEEYADCLLMVFAFCNFLNVSLDENFEEQPSNNLIDQFIYLYEICSKIEANYNKEYIKKILSNFIYLGKLLNFSDKDIIDGCINKINKNKVRLSTNY